MRDSKYQVELGDGPVAGETALMRAAQAGNWNAMQPLLKDAATKKTINRETTSLGLTALYLAAQHGYDWAILPLKRAGATIIPAVDGTTAVHVAAQNGHAAIVRMLMYEFGAGYTDRGKNGETPLFLAAQNGHFDIVEYFLSEDNPKQENVLCFINKQRTEDGATALFQAARNGHARVVDLLLVNGAAQIARKNGATPLFAAAAQGHLAILKALLAAGAQYQSRDNGATPLAGATEYDKDDLVDFLLNAEHPQKQAVRASIDQVWGEERYTALFVAAEKGNFRIVSLLLAAGAQQRACADGRTPLLAAVAQGHVEVVRALLEAGARQVMAADGTTPLFIAAGLGNLPMLRLLLSHLPEAERGDHINARETVTGVNALYRAVQSGNRDAVSALLDVGAQQVVAVDGTSPLFVAAGAGHTEIASRLLDNLPKDSQLNPINARQQGTGATALYEAAKSGHANIVRLLLSRGARYLPCESGITALVVALLRKHKQVVSYLLSGENPELEAVKQTINNCGVSRTATTAIHAALGDKDSMILLLEAGASPNALDQKSRTAILAAFDKQDFASVALLLIYGALLSREEADLVKQYRNEVVDAICVLTRAPDAIAYQKRVAQFIERVGVCPNGRVETDQLLKKAFFDPRIVPLGLKIFAKKPAVDDEGSQVSKLKELYGQLPQEFRRHLGSVAEPDSRGFEVG